MSYSGPDAQKAFEEDFLIYSKSHSFTFQLYGHNRSEIPSLIFWKVLLPSATFGTDLGFWGKVYIRALREQHHCQDHELWLDVEKGIICRGPKGPYHEPFALSSMANYASLPSLAELLQEDTSLRFWASLKSGDVDREVVYEILQPWLGCDTDRPVIEPTVFRAWNFDDGNDRVGVDERIAVGNVLWTSWSGALGEREVFESTLGGLTRFTLRHNPHRYSKIRLAQDEWEERAAWATQAFCVLHARGVSDMKGGVNTDDSLEIHIPGLTLQGIVERKLEVERPLSTSIYLFLRPPSPSTPTTSCTTGSFHFWSLEPTGQHPLPDEECTRLGLPTELEFDVCNSKVSSWDTDAYTRMYLYQLARGFDPKTLGFSQWCGYQCTFRAVDGDSDRFEEVSETSDNNKAGTFWGKLSASMPSWSYSASEDSDIPVVSL
ncbi:hypothetical protein PQX77_013886 [Marasmius sp. AFHP31]|nr:hypothetical protein PQX77_013886 [Marasmius sp. AFHP31]